MLCSSFRDPFSNFKLTVFALFLGVTDTQMEEEVGERNKTANLKEREKENYELWSTALDRKC